MATAVKILKDQINLYRHLTEQFHQRHLESEEDSLKRLQEIKNTYSDLKLALSTLTNKDKVLPLLQDWLDFSAGINMSAPIEETENFIAKISK